MVLAKEQPKNIIAHVSLGHEAEAVWIDALADIGKPSACTATGLRAF